MSRVVEVGVCKHPFAEGITGALGNIDYNKWNLWIQKSVRENLNGEHAKVQPAHWEAFMESRPSKLQGKGEVLNCRAKIKSHDRILYISVFDWLSDNQTTSYNHICFEYMFFLPKIGNQHHVFYEPESTWRILPLTVAGSHHDIRLKMVTQSALHRPRIMRLGWSQTLEKIK